MGNEHSPNLSNCVISHLTIALCSTEAKGTFETALKYTRNICHAFLLCITHVVTCIIILYI